MAIERLKRVALLVPIHKSKPITEEVYRLGTLHLTDVSAQFPSARTHLRRLSVTPKEAEERLQRLEFLLSVLKPFRTTKRSFIENFFPLPIQVKGYELEGLLASFPVERFYEECRGIESQRRALEGTLRDIEEEGQALKGLGGLPWAIGELRRIKRVKLRLAWFSRVYWKGLTSDPKARELLAWQEIPQGQGTGDRGQGSEVRGQGTEDRGQGTEHYESKNPQSAIHNPKFARVLLASLPQEEEEIIRLLNLYGYQEITLPGFSGSVEDRLKELEAQRKSILEQLEALKGRLLELATLVPKLEVLAGYWECQREKLLQESTFHRSKRLMFIGGYVREKDVSTLEAMLQDKFPEAWGFYRDPQPGEEVPVSLALSRPFRPAKFLVDMFGLPNYFTFDPTPFIVFNFFLFFGLCFGDAIYGLALMGLSYWYMRRLEANPTARDFFSLFFYAGISTTIFGVLTGGWAGDLYKPEYLGEDNFLLRLKESLCLIDPLSDILLALGCALAVGVVNQFYALFLKMYKEYRMGRPLDGLMDGGLWILFLPGIIIFACSIFYPMPHGLMRTARVLLIVGAVGLVLTQGRREKGLVAKFLTGLVSLYGIMGTYGCTSFIGDIISYSRLLALGLTTTIIGMAFNIIAGLVGQAGTVFFVLTLIFGHTLNFFISIVGAFVHPARLIFLEFFGRFYEGGGLRFKPYGFQSSRIRLLR
jgi:V/A-type H+-transporting ATPase subunit I